VNNWNRPKNRSPRECAARGANCLSNYWPVIVERLSTPSQFVDAAVCFIQKLRDLLRLRGPVHRELAGRLAQACLHHFPCEALRNGPPAAKRLLGFDIGKVE